MAQVADRSTTPTPNVTEGAYSTAGRPTISSATPGNGMPQAIQMILHEASHTDPMEQALREGTTAGKGRIW